MPRNIRHVEVNAMFVCDLWIDRTGYPDRSLLASASWAVPSRPTEGGTGLFRRSLPHRGTFKSGVNLHLCQIEEKKTSFVPSSVFTEFKGLGVRGGDGSDYAHRPRWSVSLLFCPRGTEQLLLSFRRPS